jgi:hypothetical protein
LVIFPHATYGRSSLTGLGNDVCPFEMNPCSSVSSVVNEEIVRRVEGLLALGDPLELRLAEARGQVVFASGKMALETQKAWEHPST